MSTCKDDVSKPEVDNSAEECCGIYPSNCVVSSSRDTFLGFGKGDTLTNILKKISDAIKSLASLQTHKVYTATITQGTTTNPNLNNVENPHGFSITPTYVSVGTYKLTFSAPVLTTNTYVTLPSNNPFAYLTTVSITSTTEITITTKTPAGTLTNSLLNNTPLMIRIKK